MTIHILKSGNLLLLNYMPDRFSGEVDWVAKRLDEDGEVCISKVFYFTKNHVEDDTDDDWLFKLGVLNRGYYVIDKDILSISYDLRIHSSCSITPKIFIANRGLSVFKNMDAVISESITIGGGEDGSIPEAEFRELLRLFPTQTELKHYVRSRITRILKDYFETTTDAQSKFETYLNKKRIPKKVSREPLSKAYEVKKYEFIRAELLEMLDAEESFDEKEWQNKILPFLLLLFPKYVAVLDNLHIKDYYSNPGKVTNRYIDITLADANGNIDIIEIKKPFSNCLVSKGTYRDNFTPKKELSGAVMQVEKYVFHLSKWGRNGEKEIEAKRSADLPNGFTLKIINPRGMVILGREKGLTQKQLFDLELFKRKYRNIMDILTYDDLLKRLNNIIEMMKR
ncbi:MAG: hypothetical protein COA93_10960 [Alphaproteobacteria bacterium]|nr:MAG: hypothetical protein COA93_10960 [Alphaproteobacteria bacterium]